MSLLLFVSSVCLQDGCQFKCFSCLISFKTWIGFDRGYQAEMETIIVLVCCMKPVQGTRFYTQNDFFLSLRLFCASFLQRPPKKTLQKTNENIYALCISIISKFYYYNYVNGLFLVQELHIIKA